MAKVAKPKSKAPSIHSRAARRAASPSLNTDRSLKEITPPTQAKSNFFSVQNGGIRKRKNKQVTRGQKLRQQKGIERADIVKEQLEVKRIRSLGKAKVIKNRAKEWEDLNASNEKSLAKGAFAALADEGKSDVNRNAELDYAVQLSTVRDESVEQANGAPIVEETVAESKLVQGNTLEEVEDEIL